MKWEIAIAIIIGYTILKISIHLHIKTKQNAYNYKTTKCFGYTQLYYQDKLKIKMENKESSYK